jgi:hypothetical protein
VLVESVKDFFRGHDADCAARLSDIARRLEDEKEFVERMLQKNGASS